MAHHTKLIVVAVCLAAIALASAGGVGGQAERRGRETGPSVGLGGNGRVLLPPPGRHGNDGTGSGGALPPPAPAAAPLPVALDAETAAPAGHHGGQALQAPATRGGGTTPAQAGGHGHDRTGGLGVLPAGTVDLEIGASAEFVDEKFSPKGAVNMAYNVARGNLPGFHTQLRQVLATSRKVDGIHVLVRQTYPAPPPTWIKIQLHGGTPQEKITIAVRNDNIYIVGFSNAAGTWFAFKEFKHLIDGSTALPREHDYGSLVGGHMNLVGVDISREAAVEAVRFLSIYRLSDNKSHQTNLGINLARLCVIIADAARFKSIYNTVLEQRPRLTSEEAKLVVLWAKMSRALMTGDWKEDREKLGDANIKGPQDAINALNLLIWPKGVKLNQMGAEGNDTFCNNATNFCN